MFQKVCSSRMCWSVPFHQLIAKSHQRHLWIEMLRCICCWVAVITRDANWDNPAILIIAKFIRTSGSETVSADLRSGRFAVTNFLNIYFVVDIKSNKFWWWRKKGRKKWRATHATEFYMWVIKKNKIVNVFIGAWKSRLLCHFKLTLGSPLWLLLGGEFPYGVLKQTGGASQSFIYPPICSGGLVR